MSEKPMEFWIEDGCAGAQVITQIAKEKPKDDPQVIHVIEYSAYADEKNRADENGERAAFFSNKWSRVRAQLASAREVIEFYSAGDPEIPIIGQHARQWLDENKKESE